MRAPRLLLCAVLAAAAPAAMADEGMWMLNRIDSATARAMEGLGLRLTPAGLYSTDKPSLKDCVVDFGDFCSGVVVSGDGLVLTNHHCGYGAIQALSTPGDDILKNGFVARSRSEERPAEGLFVRFLERTEECTGRVMRAMDSLYRARRDTQPAEVERLWADSVCSAVEAEYRAAHPGRYCQVKAYYGGNAYYASVYKVYSDVRLVFTATETMGKFGGDTDNWMWPRQTCDFSVFRVYAGKDGEPADYSPDNVPLRPLRHARVSLEGYAPGDFCMTVGYPGSTSRYLSSWGVEERAGAVNVATIQVRGKKQEVWRRFMDADRAVAIKYASKWASSSNYWKNSIGMNKALADLGVADKKRAAESRLARWAEGRPDLRRRFGAVLPDLRAAYAARRAAVRARSFFNETFMRGIEIYRVASMLDRLPQDADSAQLASTRRALRRFFKDYDVRLDEAAMAALLANYREQVTDTACHPALYADVDSLFGGDCAAYARDLFARTVCLDTSCLDRVLADSSLRVSDPAMRYARSLPDKLMDITGGVRGHSAVVSHGERLLTQAMLEMDQETPHYSDANFTMRLSYGFVQDYTSGLTRYSHYTDAASLLEKAARQDEVEDYRLEPDIVELMRRGEWGRYADRRTGDMHLCFLSNNDITGGNSGSPMFNARGELIGLVFDGNWDAMSGDISFDSDLQRCIGVDIRYVLFVIDKWGKAPALIREMGL